MQHQEAKPKPQESALINGQRLREERITVPIDFGMLKNM
jgi:hypothetical protein